MKEREGDDFPAIYIDSSEEALGSTARNTKAKLSTQKTSAITCFEKLIQTDRFARNAVPFFMTFSMVT